MATVIVSSGNSPYNVSSGQTDTNDVVVSGGSMFVLSGGEADRAGPLSITVANCAEITSPDSKRPGGYSRAPMR